MDYDVIIVGAGAAGLIAAKDLSAQKMKVLVLEAQDRLGGKIRTVTTAAFPVPIEEGPEWVHGELPISLALLKEAGIEVEPSEEKMLRIENGKFREDDAFIEGWDEVIQHMQELKDDITLAEFLDRFFSGEGYAQLRVSIQRFAEGFDLADINTASTLALKEEWEHEDETQYRIPGGYSQLIDYLEKQCLAHNCKIVSEVLVKEIEWNDNGVKVISDTGETFIASKLLVTASPGLLTASPDSKSYISFSPGIDHYREAANKIGYGTVSKVFMLFENSFSEKLKEPVFLLSDQELPTWWTKPTGTDVLLTGWLGGPKAKSPDYDSPQKIKPIALNSLANIFQLDVETLQSKLKAFRFVNWNQNPFTVGAYTFNLLETHHARQLLRKGVHQTIFFAGEGLYEGSALGTVEAALHSGKEVAREIVASLYMDKS